MVVNMDKLLYINPIVLAFIATMFTYFINLLGSCTVLLFKNVSKKLLDCFLAFGAGIMIASSFLNNIFPFNLSNIKIHSNHFCIIKIS